MKLNASANDESKKLSSGQTATSPERGDTWHTLSVEDAAARLQTDVMRGLSDAEASVRLAQSGPNTLTEVKRRSTLSIFIHQFRSLIVVLLLPLVEWRSHLEKTSKRSRF